MWCVDISAATVQENRDLSKQVADLEEKLYYWKQTAAHPHAHQAFGGPSQKEREEEILNLKRRIAVLEGANVSAHCHESGSFVRV